MDLVWIALAFMLGLGARLITLPPMIGYLLAGFVLNAFGVQADETLDHIGDLGVQILLFGIGLKLKLRSLLQPEIWGTTSIHMICSMALFTGLFWLLAGTGAFAMLDVPLHSIILAGFALSFSSTVFAVKVLEERGETASLHGRVAIGILVVQDIFAVLFLTASTGKIPSLWAVVLLASLPLVKRALHKLLDNSGHGELLVLFGVCTALLAGARLFDVVGLKPDLGALVMGLLLASHSKAKEVSDALLSFKDLFLVGFFLSIGLSCMPSVESTLLAVLLILVIPFKSALYTLPSLRFHLSPRTATLISLNLSNFSEFGLIVCALSVRQGWLPVEWLALSALAVSFSFVTAAPLNKIGHTLATKWSGILAPLATTQHHPEEAPVSLWETTAVVCGMGRVGRGAYDQLETQEGERVLGIEVDPDKVAHSRAKGRNVINADATNIDFWQRTQDRSCMTTVITTMEHKENIQAIHLLRDNGFTGRIIAAATHEEHLEQLMDAGATTAFDLFKDAGAGLAMHSKEAPEEE